MSKFNAKLFVGLVSDTVFEEDFTVDPDYCAVGAFQLKDKDGNLVCFDFNQADYRYEYLGGNLVVDAVLSGFDMDYFIENNPPGTRLDWEDLFNGEIVEVYHEIGFTRNGVELPPLKMQLDGLSVIVPKDPFGFELDEFEFMDDDMRRYNEKELIK